MVEHLRAVLRGTEPGDGANAGRFKAIATRAGSLIVGERGPTRFASGAFRESLNRSTKYPLLLQHHDDRVIGIANFSEGAEGLLVDGELVLEVTDAKETYALMRAGALTDVSIGFEPRKVHSEVHDGEPVRIIDEARLMECSVVTWGADKKAKILAVHSETELAFDGLVEGLNAARREAHEGRVFSEASLGKLRAALGSLVDLVGRVDPGHIAALGRMAARMMKKSIVLVPGKKRGKKAAATYRSAQLRNAELLAVGVSVSDLPLLPQPMPMPEPDPEYGLLRTLESICQLPEAARRALFVEAVKQYLLAANEAEPAGDDEDEEGEDYREAHIHNPHVVEAGGKFNVVDDDGKVYGTHDTRPEADAQVAALRAAKAKD